MREVTPVERALFMLEKFEQQIAMMKAELSAFLPDDDRTERCYILDPLTGRRRPIKRGGIKRRSDGI